MKKIYSYILMAVALVATASCSQNETLEPAAPQALAFTVGEFPTFGEVQSRAIGTQDAGKTAWEEGDVITVTFTSAKCGVQTATLTYNGSAWTPSASFTYIENETPTVTAVYNPSATPGMGEYLTTTDYSIADNTLNISFANATRTYSRLRIAALADETLTVTTTGFTPAGATAVPTEAYTLTADTKGNAYLYGIFSESGTVTVKDGDAELANYAFNEATEAGKSYALFAGVTVDLSTQASTYVINDSKNYRFTGTNSGDYGIKVASGNPTIILNNVSITVSSVSAIEIASGSNTTIWVQGDNTIGVTSDNEVGGIFVAEGGTVNITSDSRDNILRITGYQGAAIGGKYDNDSWKSYNAGNINISGVTVYAYASYWCSAAIGAAGEGTCGTIRIIDATVYAYGNGDDYDSTPGIGNARSDDGPGQTIPVVIISDSEIHTFRKTPYSDYIGYFGSEWDEGEGYATNSINCGEGGSVTNSTIYCYTGLEATTTDKVVTYDAEGNATEQTAE